GAYYRNIVGADALLNGKSQSQPSGISTPDDQTLVLKLTEPTGALATAQALALPATIPVPKSYASKYDTGSQSTYGQHQVFTGPYMIANNGQGKLTGYVPGKKIALVRNPDWNGPKTGDYRPAYLNTITFLGGNDISVASRRIISGQSLAQGDFAAPPPAQLKQLATTKKSQT